MKVIKLIINFIAGLTFVLSITFLAGYYNLIPAFKVFVVLSGSMEPAVKIGSLAIAIPSTTYNNNDVISFYQDSDKKNIVTHRIVFKNYLNQDSNQAVYLTKGDANKNFDSGKINNNQIIGKMFLTIPYLGYAANFVKHPYGFILLVVIPATIIVYEELKNLGKQLKEFFDKLRIKNEEITTTPFKKNGINKLAIVLPVMAAAFALTSLSLSYFSDKENSLANNFQAGVWITPQPPTPTIIPPTPTPTPNYLANHIVISEVQITEGAGKTTHDFIELYNPTNNSINLKGHRLVKRTGNSPNDTSIKSWTSDTFIPAHGFYLWASSDDSSYPATIGADTSTTSTLGAENSIALRQGPEDTGTLIDVLSWNDGSTLVEGDEFNPDPGPGQSMERKAYSTSDTASMMTGSDIIKGNAYDSENNFNDFILRTTSQPQNTGSTPEIP